MPAATAVGFFLGLGLRLERRWGNQPPHRNIRCRAWLFAGRGHLRELAPPWMPWRPTPVDGIPSVYLSTALSDMLMSGTLFLRAQ